MTTDSGLPELAAAKDRIHTLLVERRQLLDKLQIIRDIAYGGTGAPTYSLELIHGHASEALAEAAE